MKAARVPLGRLGWRRLVIPAISMCATRHYSALAPAVASGLERARVRRDDLLVVSVSGGADSVALLRLLLALNGDDAAEWRLDLHVLHFNHALRPEAAAEEEFVRALAAQHGLPVHVRRLEPGWADDGASGGVQGRSRAWRRAESLALLRRSAPPTPPPTTARAARSRWATTPTTRQRRCCSSCCAAAT